MRLICPNCGAQYEVPTDVIPDEGRDVQCSSCGTTWFQPHPSYDPALTQEVEDTAPPVPERPVPPRKALPDDVEAILREEADRESRARAAERQSLESQPDLGLDDLPSRVDAEPAAPVAETPVPEAVPVAPVPRRRKQSLPDVDDINATLRSASEPRDEDSASPDEDTPAAKPARKGGFGKGLRWSLILAVLAALAYVFAPQIIETVPALEVALAPYVDLIDQARLALDGLINSQTGGS